MAPQIGAVLIGKVTGITQFGAFVSMEGGISGLVHISEISNNYVADINQILTIGQEVKVKILSIDPKGKLSLSIKQTDENAPASNGGGGGGYKGKKNNKKNNEPLDPLEEMLKKFKQASEEKTHDLKRREGKS